MRFFLPAALCVFLIGCASAPRSAIESVEIKEIKPRYMETEQFKRVGEYLTGKENQGDRIIIRSQPEVRDGYYFTLVLDTKANRLPRGTRIIGEFFTPFGVEQQTHTFKLPPRVNSTREIFVGLTGEDWPEPDAVPAAWRFTLEDANGRSLGSAQSYLWSL